MLITVGWLATLYAWRQKWQRQQQAWQWWQQQQATQSHHTAESIRDGLLQQTFAFRRYMENIDTADGLAGTSDTSQQNQTHDWLNRFQSFHQSLEALSDELSPPFVADSLPHALQFTLKSWQTNQKLNPCHIELPQTWHYSTPQQNQAVMSILNALLTFLLPSKHSATQLSATLSHQDSLNSLLVTIKYNEPPESQEQPELSYLKEIFHSLTAGQLTITHETFSMTSELSWQNTHLVD